MLEKDYYLERIKTIYPNADFTLLKYTGPKEEIVLQCNRCNQIHSYTCGFSSMNILNFCNCEKYFRDTKEKVFYMAAISGITILNYQSTQNIEAQCNYCGRVWKTRSQLFMTGGKCSCQKKLTIPQIQSQIDKKFGKDNYSILKYESKNTKALIRHNKCGLAFSQSPGHFLDGCGCPHCYKKRSRGETAIWNWLEDKKINFIPQYTIHYKNQLLYGDFFLPSFNILIEYQGEQHYKPVKNFGGVNGHLAQVKRDENKRAWCKENNIELIEIPYWNLKEISNILSLRFNDYPVKE